MSLRQPGRLLAVAGTALILAAGLGSALVTSAAADTPAPVQAARLQGPFQLAGRVTVAKRVAGERRGLNFIRTWTFFPTCPEGPCDVVVLIRERTAGTDRLTLHHVLPGVYSGAGRFFAPLRCGRRTYVRGQSVPFTVTVQITAAATVTSGAVFATRVSATYTNTARTNLTRCFAVLGHDAAAYHGQIPVPGQL